MLVDCDFNLIFRDNIQTEKQVSYQIFQIIRKKQTRIMHVKDWVILPLLFNVE
jgi:hypothetical protein